MKLTEILLKSNVNEVADLLCKSDNNEMTEKEKRAYLKRLDEEKNIKEFELFKEYYDDPYISKQWLPWRGKSANELHDLANTQNEMYDFITKYYKTKDSENDENDPNDPFGNNKRFMAKRLLVRHGINDEWNY